MDTSRAMLTLLAELEHSGALFPREAAIYIALRSLEHLERKVPFHEVVVQTSGAVVGSKDTEAKPTLDTPQLMVFRWLLVSTPSAPTALVEALASTTDDADRIILLEEALRPLHREAMERLLGRIVFSEHKNPFVDPNNGIDSWAEAR